MPSKHARKQRKAQFNAPIHKRRKLVASHLTDALSKQYNRRSALVVEGDTVKVVRGDDVVKGVEGKVTKVDTKTGRLIIEGITMPKADNTQKARPIHASNVMITKLDLADPLRKAKLEKTREASQ
ncbi:MAG TPA: 50S ribosomal protein L24 [Methanomassiliicoccales archaeon]|nr:50S ribosomal protein L24 [Methanomassiliicoccales archaeon]